VKSKQYGNNFSLLTAVISTFWLCTSNFCYHCDSGCISREVLSEY
jgi:hypothetical protein